jgi:hypothetical protein
MFLRKLKMGFARVQAIRLRDNNSFHELKLLRHLS